MCLIVVALDATPRYPLIVARIATSGTRGRRPAPRGGPIGCACSAGAIAKRAARGLALERGGRFAAVTNIREADRPVGLRSRGSLVAEFVAGSAVGRSSRSRAWSATAPRCPVQPVPVRRPRAHVREQSRRGCAARPRTAFVQQRAGRRRVAEDRERRAGVERLLADPAPLEPLFALLAERDDSGTAEQR